MIAASAMLFLAQAVTPCTTAGTPRLGGGAVMVRPVTSFERAPFLPLGPATGIRSEQPQVQRTAAPAAPEGTDEPAEQCEVTISIT